MYCHITNFSIQCNDLKRFSDLFDVAQIRLKGSKGNFWSCRRPLSPSSSTPSIPDTNTNTNAKRTTDNVVDIGPLCGAIKIEEGEGKFPISLFLRRSADKNATNAALKLKPHEWTHDGQVERLRPSSKTDSITIPGSKKNYPSERAWNSQLFTFVADRDFGCNPPMTLTLKVTLDVSDDANKNKVLSKSVDKILTCRSALVPRTLTKSFSSTKGDELNGWNVVSSFQVGTSPKQSSNDWPTSPVFCLFQAGNIRFTPGSEHPRLTSTKQVLMTAEFSKKNDTKKKEVVTVDLKSAIEWNAFQFSPYDEESSNASSMVVRCEVPLVTSSSSTPNNSDFPLKNIMVELLMTIEDKDTKGGSPSALSTSPSLANTVVQDGSNTPMTAGTQMNASPTNSNSNPSNINAAAASPSPVRTANTHQNQNQNQQQQSPSTTKIVDNAKSKTNPPSPTQTSPKTNQHQQQQSTATAAGTTMSNSASLPPPPPQILKQRHELDLKKKEKLQKVRLRLMEDEIKSIYTNFARYDKNGDGVLDEQELSLAIKEAVKDGMSNEKTIQQLVKDFIEACDDNGDGKLNVNEVKYALVSSESNNNNNNSGNDSASLAAANAKEAADRKQQKLESIKSRLMEDEIQLLLKNFKKYDKNNDQTLDRKELFEAVKTTLGDNVSSERTIHRVCADIVFVCDDNGDGSVTLKELTSLLAQEDPNVDQKNKAKNLSSSSSTATSSTQQNHQHQNQQSSSSINRSRFSPPMSPPASNKNNNSNNQSTLSSPPHLRDTSTVLISPPKTSRDENDTNANKLISPTTTKLMTSPSRVPPPAPPSALLAASSSVAASMTTTASLEIELLRMKLQQTEAALKVALQRAEDAEDHSRLMDARIKESERIRENRSRRENESVMRIYQSARHLANICEVAAAAASSSDNHRNGNSSSSSSFTSIGNIRNSMEDAQFEISRLIRSPAVPGVAQRHLMTVQGKLLKGLEELSSFSRVHASSGSSSNNLMVIDRTSVREAVGALHDALVYVE